MRYIIATIGILLLVIAFSGCIDQDIDEGNVSENITPTNQNATTLVIDNINGSYIIDTGMMKINGISDPNANVTINGEPVTLNPDGSFTYEIPVEALMEIKIIAEAPGKEPSTITITIEELTSNSVNMTIDSTGAARINNTPII